jgi:hypothetical protein
MANMLGIDPLDFSFPRPDDIPQDVWEVADVVLDGNAWNPIRTEAIARAIMARDAVVREQCEAICVARCDRLKAAVASYPDDEPSRVACLEGAIEALECATAIRKGGQ